MKDFPKGGLIGKTLEGARMISAMHIPFRAAYGAYFLILSLFPALLLVLSSLRLTGLTVEDLVELVSGILPAAMVEGAEGLIYSTYRNASSAVTGLSVVTLLWSSSKGVYGLLTGLNAVYDVEEDRGYVFTRAISVVYALLFLVVLVLTLVLGFELKTAIGTSVFIMSFTALFGAVSHFALGAKPNLWVMFLCIATTLIAAEISAVFANNAPLKKLNKAVGVCLLIFAVVLILLNVFGKTA